MRRIQVYCSLVVLAGLLTTRPLSAQDSTEKKKDSTAVNKADSAAAKPADSAGAKPMDTTAAKPAAAAAAMGTGAAAAGSSAPGSLSLKDVAGKWVLREMNDVGDLTLMIINMTATADTTGWSFTVGKRRPIPVRVTAVSGDSVMFEAGPYESIARKGIKVSIFNVGRLQDGKLVGASIARYATTASDSVLEMQFEGTRAP